ncbi:ATP synthase CF1 beta subunit [Iris pallida]|uniref:ATP synthase CF1 beta subunit (Plastid) n=1 Tax=Iris pallida TaxID=29817 RepID=A0AAX6G4X2_IRIPA|nr:ATP synthase CF1 beta subunit [Iris pallida]
MSKRLTWIRLVGWYQLNRVLTPIYFLLN